MRIPLRLPGIDAGSFHCNLNQCVGRVGFVICNGALKFLKHTAHLGKHHVTDDELDL